MSELRWILAGLGALLLAVLYFWGRKGIRGSSPASEREVREPTIGSLEEADEDTFEQSDKEIFGALDESPPLEASSKLASQPAPRQPEKIIALRLVAKEGDLSAEKAVNALCEAGLQHGRFGIFHMQEPSDPREASFSVASLVEPGSFDLTNLQDETLPGMSFFIVLPGAGDPVQRFDAMIETARALAVQLDAELLDDGGSSWSIQRERYLREELIRYRHQSGRR